MDAGEIAIGMRVRYPRTGTTGMVERLETLDNHLFAELDSNHLRYRVDQLIPVSTVEEKAKREKEDLLKIVEQERELAATLREEMAKSDEMCDGGG